MGSPRVIGSQFGLSVSLKDGVLAVGAPGTDGVGAAYVYGHSSSEASWYLWDKLTPEDTTPNQWFGTSVSFDDSESGGMTVAVGAPGNYNVSGVVYVYDTQSDVWSLQAKLTQPADAAGSGTDAVGFVDAPYGFGVSVSVRGDVLAVGSPSQALTASAGSVTVDDFEASGDAYVYHRDAGSWSLMAHLAPDVSEPDMFGRSVAVAGDLTVLVGAPGHAVGDNQGQGAVYAYDWTGQLYQEPSMLVATGGSADDGMGGSLAVSHGVVLAGAPAATVAENEGQGTASLFTLPGPTATVGGFTHAWQDAAPRLSFSGVVPTGAAAVDYVQYRVGSGVWTTGASVRITRQGATKVQYRAVDIFGTIGAAKTCTVRLDTKRPRMLAKKTFGKTGTIVRVRYRVKDARPGSGTAKVRVVVKNAAGAVVTRAATIPVTTNAWHTVRVKALRLSPGAYRVLLRAVDRAGNAQHGWRATTLTVK